MGIFVKLMTPFTWLKDRVDPNYWAERIGNRTGVYEKSHKKGYYKHTPYNRLGSSHLEKSVYGKFNMKILKVKSGDAVLLHSAIVHGTWMTKKKGFVKYILCDRFNPLQKIPYLKNLKIKLVKLNLNQILLRR